MSRNRDTSLVAQNGGVAATPFQAGKNLIINGGFDIWQRGTTANFASNTGSQFLATDRFFLNSGSTGGTIAQDTDVPSGLGLLYSYKVTPSAAQTSGDFFIGQRIENGKALLAGRTATLSFYAKASAATGSFYIAIDQDYATNTFSSGLSTSWTRYTYTFTFPSNFATSYPAGAAGSTLAESRILRFNSNTTNLGAVSIWVAGVQLEIGSTATPFSRAGGTLQGELAACQRYYWRQTADSTAVYALLGYGPGLGTTTVGASFVNPVAMRTLATSVDYLNLQVNDGVTITSVTSISLIAARSTSRISSTDCVTGGGLTATRFYNIGVNNSSTGYIGFSAEL